jgi:flagellar protein FlaJ
MFEDLKKNIEQEKKIIADAQSVINGMEDNPYLRPFYLSSLSSLMQQLKLLNKTVPELLKENSPLKKFTKEVPEKEEKVVRMTYVSPSTKEKNFITIDKKDRKEFLEKLKLSEENLEKIKKKKSSPDLKNETIRHSGAYTKFSNKFFREISEKISPKFTGISQDLKKGNTGFLLQSYISVAIMSIVLSFIFGVIIFILLLMLNFNNWTFIWLPFGITGITTAGFYLYPSSEASSVQKEITQEIPFATIHMAAIASSDIEPTKIFKIISKSKEYPSIGKEINKIVTQTELYGYDLVTALKNVASRTSNKKLSELFSGLATNISTGGELKTYLESKAENFLLDYRLERQKYTELAGTFMDIYISILITAPLVLMMMFIVMNVSGLGIGGMGIEILLILSIVTIAIVNVLFIIILNIKQPKV